ncbi:Protein CBG22476 [Caenorhabditis briggsae]|uniref:Protein CBG22476 n=1 Tax=Caenorhabditis briggsae TaxID=6238 RepID=A8Y2D6_CAEBR|nr:Protein CBG22476 [Caenorhabditis briggsae]CAP39057.2 Protein CBG22476 [Caenorhabditis briggsae]
MDKIVTLKSLKELAILKSAEAFQKSQIQIPAGKLTNEENNELFEQIPAHFSAENSDRMIENFNLTRLILNSRDLKPDLLKISHSMNLEDFELNLKKEVTPFGGVTKFDLPTALLQCLNPETRQKLRTLKIEASTHRFVRGWAQQLCQLVPNLQSLSIHDFPIAKYEFRTICSSLKFLTTLEISRMEIPTLNGISKLQNLKNLIMNSINCLNFEDLFNLRNLEYLDLSALRSMFHSDDDLDLSRQAVEVYVTFMFHETVTLSSSATAAASSDAVMPDGDCVATWNVPLHAKVHRIEFEHGTTTGKRVIRVDGKLGDMKCNINVEALGTFAYEYSLDVNGKTFNKFKEEQNKKLHSWETTIAGNDWRVVLDKETMEIWANGCNINTAVQTGVIHTLFINGTQIPSMAELAAVASS